MNGRIQRPGHDHVGISTIVAEWWVVISFSLPRFLLSSFRHGVTETEMVGVVERGKLGYPDVHTSRVHLARYATLANARMSSPEGCMMSQAHDVMLGRIKRGTGCLMINPPQPG